MYYTHYTYTEEACKILRDNNKLNVHLTALVSKGSFDQELVQVIFVVVPEDVYAENYKVEIDFTTEVFNDECGLDEIANITSPNVDTRISLRIAYLIYKIQKSIETHSTNVFSSLTKYVKEVEVTREPLRTGYCEGMAVNSLD